MEPFEFLLLSRWMIIWGVFSKQPIRGNWCSPEFVSATLSFCGGEDTCVCSVLPGDTRTCKHEHHIIKKSVCLMPLPSWKILRNIWGIYLPETLLDLSCFSDVFETFQQTSQRLKFRTCINVFPSGHISVSELINNHADYDPDTLDLVSPWGLHCWFGLNYERNFWMHLLNVIVWSTNNEKQQLNCFGLN